jgi:PPOX class probable F420-dependent enzyme
VRENALARARFAAAPVARLATVRADGRPHVVPVCFAVDGDTVVSVVDAKPKRSANLLRLDNVRAHGQASVLVDHYVDDWSRLWWVRADGDAAVLETGPGHARAVDRLVEKYEQYRVTRPRGSVIVVTVSNWASWSADGNW